MERNWIANLHLNDLCQPHPDRPGWSITFGASCADAAAVCLTDQAHPNPVNLHIEGIRVGQINLAWNEVNETVRRFNADREVATEYGAYGITALIMPVLTNLTVIERSVKGKNLGFDFWLGDLHDQSPLFQRKARLEVSGIREGSSTQIQSRVNIKSRQISPSDAVAPGYVIVVEFSNPQAKVVEKCKT